MGEWLDVLALGGHAPYVWGSFAAALALILIEVVLLLLRQRAILGHLGWPRRDPQIKTPITSARPRLDGRERNMLKSGAHQSNEDSLF